MSAHRNAAYNDLDGAIVRELARGPKTFTCLQGGEVRAQCRKLANLSGSSVNVTRTLDRRLQALRRAGKIRYRRGPGAAWELVP